MEPITREEKFLQKIIDELKNGGGSNSDEIKPINLQDKTITENGTYTADDGYDGIGTVVVEVSGSGDSGGEDEWKEMLIGIVDGTAIEVTLPDGLTKIDNRAFMYGNMKRVIVPSGVVSVGSSAFASCSSLVDIVLPETVTMFSTGSFYMCKQLDLTNLPSNLENIPYECFRGCAKLALTSLPDEISSIGGYAFYECSKLAITRIPSKTLTIDSAAFCLCSGLREITFDGTPSDIKSNVFSSCPNITVINVPWSEGEVANAPWGATNATINYNYTGE